MSVVEAVRGLVERTPEHRVISVYLDLDPERFATAPARASQIRSLIDEAARMLEADDTLSHEEKTALREDLEQVRSYLRSREPFQGARGLAVFSSVRDGLFETIQLRKPIPARVVIDRRPYVEPLVDAAERRRWCVVLVSRRQARLFAGPADRLEERRSLEDDVHGQHDQGGWSQANYERSVEKDTDDHLRRVADMLKRQFASERFDRLALGGPPEIVPRLEALLGEDVRAVLVPRRGMGDVLGANEEQVRLAVARLAEEDEKRHERETLDRLAAGIGTGGRATGGPEATLQALGERRVGTLLLEPAFDGRGGRCAQCGLLTVEEQGRCPADGSELELLEHLREGAVESAIAQDADVLVVRHYPDLGPHRGIAALLRF